MRKGIRQKTYLEANNLKKDKMHKTRGEGGKEGEFYIARTKKQIVNIIIFT